MSSSQRPWFDMRGDAGVAFLLAVAAFATRALFLYRGAMPDPDALMMAAGMAIDMNGDVPRGDALLYGRHVSPGYSFLVGWLYPLVFDSPRFLVACLNWSTAVFSGLTAAVLYLLAREHVARSAAIGMTAVWTFNAVAWESGTYFHTIVPCMGLLLAAMMLARGIDSSRRGIARYACTVVVATAAFVTRTEIVFAWPALLVWTLTSARPRRNTLLLVSITFIVLAVYANVLIAIGKHSTVASGGFRAYLRWYAASFSPRGIDRTMVWAAFSLGIGSLAAVAIAMVRDRAAWWRSPRARRVLFGCAWVIPSTVFWLMTPVPILRHFYVAALGVAWLVGVLVFDRARWVWATAVVVIAVNLIVPEIAYAAFRARTGASKTPHGTFFAAHRYWSARVGEFVAMRESSGACWDITPPRSALALVTWEGAAHLMYRLGVSDRRVHRISKESIYPGVDVIDLEHDGGRLRIVQFVCFEAPDLRARVQALVDEARTAGDCIVVPAQYRATLGLTGSGTTPTTPVIAY